MSAFLRSAISIRRLRFMFLLSRSSTSARSNHENSAVVAYIFEKIPEIAKAAGLTNGYRIISNVGEDGCQSVHHMHFHILGGKKLSEKMD